MLDEEIQQALRELEALIEHRERFAPGRDDTVPLAQALHALLAASSSSLGECRVTTPYASLRPVIDAQGHFKWCCNHNPEHCAS